MVGSLNLAGNVFDTVTGTIGAVAIASGIDISSLLVLLFELESKDAVDQQPGQFFQKKVF